jgi:hypothetical protein
MLTTILVIKLLQQSPLNISKIIIIDGIHSVVNQMEKHKSYVIFRFIM